MTNPRQPREYPEDYYERIKPRLHRRIGREIRLARTVLDVGCGSCDLVRYLASTYRQEVTGVDQFSSSFPVSRHTPEGVTFHCKNHDATDMRFVADQSVDAVVTMWAFHEISRPKAMLNETLRVLRPGGELVIVDFPRDSLAQRLWNENYYRPADVAAMLEKAGYTEIHARLIESGQIAWITAHRKAASPQAA